MLNEEQFSGVKKSVYTPPDPNRQKMVSVEALTRHPYVEEIGFNREPQDQTVNQSAKMNDLNPEYGSYATHQVEGMKKAISEGTIDPVHFDMSRNIGYGTTGMDAPHRMVLGNGGHRVALAAAMGVKKLPVTTDDRASGADYRSNLGQQWGTDHGTTAIKQGLRKAGAGTKTINDLMGMS